MRHRVYLETTIPSYLTARPSRQLVRAGQQQQTAEWWDRRGEYELFASDLVLKECRGGEPAMAAARIAVLAGVPLLDRDGDVGALADELMAGVPLPAIAVADAGHIATAAVHAMDILLSWNCRHIANPAFRLKMEAVCRKFGFIRFARNRCRDGGMDVSCPDRQEVAMEVGPHHTADELAALIRSEKRANVGRRLAAVRLALLGQRAEDIAPLVFVTARQVRTWVGWYNAGGVADLADAPGRGRKPPLDAEQKQALAERLRAGPTAADGVCTLRGEDVRRILRDEFGLVRSLAAVYHLLHALGFEPLRPRPRHPKASAEAQAAFQKSSRPSSPRRPPPGRASGSRWGSRTRPGSARRAR